MLKDLLQVWFPNSCLNCGDVLPKSLQWLCLTCKMQVPRTYFEQDVNNPLKNMFSESLPLTSAYTPYYFHQENPIQQLIHALKYQGKKDVAAWIAQQTTSFIPKTHPIYSCEAIIPVPLHAARERKRGYNQVMLFGQFWAKQLGVPCLDSLLFRKRPTKTLVRMSHEARWNEVKDAFEIRGEHCFKHVLIVDDVITTGATLTACGQTLLKYVSKKISVLGMAYTQDILP